MVLLGSIFISFSFSKHFSCNVVKTLNLFHAMCKLKNGITTSFAHDSHLMIKILKSDKCTVTYDNECAKHERMSLSIHTKLCN